MGAAKGPPTVNDVDFDVKVSQLKDLMQLKGNEAVTYINNKFQGIEGLVYKLRTNVLTGLNGNKDDLDKRVRVFGKNQIPPKAPKSIFQLAFEAVQDTTLIMLIICAIVSISLSFYQPQEEAPSEEFGLTNTEHHNLEWVEGVAIMIAVLVVVFVTAFNDWCKERQFRGLQDRIESDNNALVIRNGQVIEINVKDIVVGDICCIKYGDLIPADGIVVLASDLKIDESSLTGETDLIKKNTHENVTILSGTHVMEGSGQFLVAAVGLNSQTGIIMTLLGATEEEQLDESVQEEKTKRKKSKKASETELEMEEVDSKPVQKNKPTKKHKSVLQLKLGRLALQIGYGGMFAALFTFIILVIRMFVEEFGIKKNQWSNVYIKYIIAYLIQGITVIVVAVPEGLPLAVTLALAFAVKKMTSDNNLVRHLDACETMGNATTICSDKTGTLTTNRMTAVQCWLGGKLHEKIPDKSQVNEQLRELVYESISVNTNYTSMIEPVSQQGELPKQIGNKTECGLLGLVNDLGGSYEQKRIHFPSDKFVKVYTFNSARKMMSTIVNNPQGGFRVHSKGASEIVLNKCSYYLDENNKIVKLDQDKINDIIKNVVERMASNGLRTICVAYRDFKSSDDQVNGPQENVTYISSVPDWDRDEDIVKDLTCVCLVGIEDPVRPEVPEAIKKCQTSGVVVRMVTGDNINTATSIAMKCGIIKPGDDFLILESKDFNKRIRDKNGEVKQELLDKVWPRLRVLARSSPQDKYILVNGIVESKTSSNREVVAVTGDGTNDGPALKRADVGFAMGIQGTDVAKEASDIILTDDNFSSIVKAMMWGRNVYDAIAKFLQFQLTANFSAGIFSVVCAATVQAVPLKAVQMLWVNLVMDTLASLALATEPPTEDLLKRKPYGRDKSIISTTMFRNIIGHTVYQLIILFSLVWWIEEWMQVDSVIKYHDINKLGNSSIHFTIIFNAFVLMTLFNELNARKIHNERNIFEGIHRNIYFLVIWIFCFIGQVLIVNFGGIVFAVERLDLDQWMWCLCFGVGSLLWGQIITCIPKRVLNKLVNQFSCCRKKKNLQLTVNSMQQIPTITIEPDRDTDNPRLMWIRSASRLHSQMLVVETFQSTLEKVRQSMNHYGSNRSLREIVNQDYEQLEN